MYPEELGRTIQIDLKNIAYLRFGRYSEYIDIISPFSRLYLILKGEGHIVINSQRIELKQKKIYLIPSYTPCSYFFNQDLEHIYIHTAITFEGGLSASNLFLMKNKTEATELCQNLFFRLLEINPSMETPHDDPHIYQTKPWINQKIKYRSPAHYFESIGILKQIYSNFVDSEINLNMSSLLKYNIQSILRFIQENLHSNIEVDELASRAYLSKDHFTRIFKSILGLPPCEFIMRKRIEKAQFLLLATNKTLCEIIEETNFKNAPYFSRMFRKYTSLTPGEYRRQSMHHI